MENIPPILAEGNQELDTPPLSIADLLSVVKVSPSFLRRHDYDAPDELTIYYQGFRSHGPVGGIKKHADAVRQDPIKSTRNTPFNEIKTDSDLNHKDFVQFQGLNEIKTSSNAGNKNSTPLQPLFNENRTDTDLNYKNTLTQVLNNDITANADPENVTLEKRSESPLHEMLLGSQRDKFQTGSLLRSRWALLRRSDIDLVQSEGVDLAQAGDVDLLRSQSVRERRNVKGKGKKKKGKKKKVKKKKKKRKG